MNTLFTRSCLILAILAFAVKANGQQILSLSYVPEYPGLDDTVTIYTTVTYPSTNCWKDSLFIEQNASKQFLVESYTCCIPGSAQLYTIVDSFEIFPDLSYQGYVDLYFMIGYFTTPDCPAFPIMVSGDTITYPTEVHHIEIPVGYVAGQEDLNETSFLFNIFPNPTESNVNVQFNLNEKSNVSLDVVDMQGKVVQSLQPDSCTKGINTVELDLLGLTNGVYTLRLKVNETCHYKKFIKQ
ncbi:MAG: T9SS type A sorting domain-containing protein [Crocinitomicaceae bacterium]|nr:T9SS type A sorting domain-containing protein [Crocinitomicaceae bacterium]